MIRIVRHAHTAVLAASVIAALSTRGAAAPAQVQDLRVGEHPGSTRVVLDISEPAEMTIDVAADGRTVTVTMPGVDWRANSFAPHRHAKGLLRGYRHAGNQLSLSTHEPVSIKTPFFVGPDGKQGHRVVIDMVADSIPAKPVAAAAATSRALAPQPINEPIAAASHTNAGLEPPADVLMASRSTARSTGYPVGQAMILSPGSEARAVETAQAVPPPRPQQMPQQMPPQAPTQRMDNPRGPFGGMMYLKGGFGVTMLEEADATGPGNTAAVETDIGWSLVGGIGIDLKNNFRIEGEVFYTTNEAQTVRGTVNGTATTAGGVNGDVSTLAFMANGAYDFVNAYAVTPYIFGGAGLAMVSLNGVAPANTTGWDDNDWVFAMQGGIGATLDFDERLSFDLGYRYFETLQLELADSRGIPFNYENAMHLFLLSLRYKF